MHWDEFTIGFWHPFGDHGENPDGTTETADQILKRKTKEAADDGWTLWSFQGDSTLRFLLEEIKKANPTMVYALCSYSSRTPTSKGTEKPKGKVRPASHYRLLHETNWHEIPNSISVPHHFGKRIEAAAFKVNRVVDFATPEHPEVSVEWFSTATQSWKSMFGKDKGQPTKGYPGRPEKLIRAVEDGAPLRPVRAVLELSYPYVVCLK